MVIGTDYIASCKSNYHTITATTARIELKEINIDKVAVSVGEATSSYHKSLSRNVTIKTIDEPRTFEQNVNKYNGTIDQYYPLGLRPSGRYWLLGLIQHVIRILPYIILYLIPIKTITSVLKVLTYIITALPIGLAAILVITSVSTYKWVHLICNSSCLGFIPPHKMSLYTPHPP